MTAAAANRGNKEEVWKYLQFTLLSGSIAYQGALCALQVSSGKVIPATANTTDLIIGSFAEKVDASSADKLVNVDLIEEVTVRWFVNATAGDAVAATDVGKIGYVLDSQTISILPAGKYPAGRIWAVDSTKGVAIQKFRDVPVGGWPLQPLPALPAFAAGDTAPTTIVNGGVYDVPTTAANSTISLPAAAADGTVAYFHADGTKNGHTLTFRDVATAISAAATASKRVAAVAIKADGKWTVTMTVGP